MAAATTSPSPAELGLAGLVGTAAAGLWPVHDRVPPVPVSRRPPAPGGRATPEWHRLRLFGRGRHGRFVAGSETNRGRW